MSLHSFSTIWCQIFVQMPNWSLACACCVVARWFLVLCHRGRSEVTFEVLWRQPLPQVPRCFALPQVTKILCFFPKSWIRVFLILLPHQKIGNYWLLCGRSFTSLRTNPEYMATSFLYIVVSYVSFASTEPVTLAVLFFFYNYAFQFVLFYSLSRNVVVVTIT